MTPNQLLAHPAVLLAAWRRVSHWYQYGDEPPQPEYARWQAAPEVELEALSSALAEGAYSSPRLPLIPYPKKGAALRHYCRPAIRDQVVFAAYGVLLAPLLERVMPNLSFGNRWFRGGYQESQPQGLCWSDRQFTLEDAQCYQPYRRAHGLFRRVAHWTAQAMLDDGPDAHWDGAGRRPIAVEDFRREKLSVWVHREWWHKPGSAEGNGNRPRLGFWAELDLQLAYPSVEVGQLRARMQRVLKQSATKDLPDLDYPEDIQEALTRDGQAVARELADQLCTLLENVTYDPSGAPGDLWKPEHAQQRLPIGAGAGHPALPTGLVISGLLLNVYLQPLDRHMERWCKGLQKSRKPVAGGRDGPAAAFLRFADDMRVFATDEDRLMGAIDAVWDGLCSTEIRRVSGKARLADPTRSNPGNLRLNLGKVGPKPVAAVVQAYLEAHGWSHDAKSGQWLPPSGSGPTKAGDTAQPQRLADWWRGSQKDAHRRALRHAALIPGHLDAFGTHLVERMSELGGESLLDRFGDRARERLTHLHEMIQFDINDQQVRLDTRLAFATGQLVRAWLPEDSLQEERQALAAMRDSVTKALRRAPWKFSLWRAVIKAAVRRPCGATESGAAGAAADGDRDKADQWLRSVLRQIQGPLRKRAVDDRPSEADDTDPTLWRVAWPEAGEGGAPPASCAVTEEGVAERDQPACRRIELALSAHRAAFWFSLAGALDDLERALEAGVANTALPYTRPWTAQDWTFRALPREALAPVRNWLADLDRWAEVLYPDTAAAKGADPAIPTEALWITPIEREALALAAMKAIEPVQAIRALCEHATRQSSAAASGSGDASAEAWAGWLLDVLRPEPMERLVRLLLPSRTLPTAEAIALMPRLLRRPKNDERARLVHCLDTSALPDAAARLRALKHLRLLRHFPSEPDGPILRADAREALEYLNALLHGRHGGPRELWALRRYADLRRALLAWNQPTASSGTEKAPTLHRLLWGDCWDDKCVDHWRIVPAQAVAEGLPIRIAAQMLRDALEADAASACASESDKSLWPPIWTLGTEAELQVAQWLADGRRCQLQWEDWAPFLQRSGPEGAGSATSGPLLVSVSTSPDAWEMWPHPLFLWPGALGVKMDPIEYRRWCHLLHLLTAVQGDERILDTLFLNGSGATPYEERWHWRHTVHMPGAFWEELERLTRLAMGRRAGARSSAFTRLKNELDGITAPPLSPEDFRWERVDIQLRFDDPWDIPVTVTPHPQNSAYLAATATLPSMTLTTGQLDDWLHVRIGQVAAHPDWKSWVTDYPHLDRAPRQHIMKQIWATFLADRHESGGAKAGPSASAGTGGGPDTSKASGSRFSGLILLPEATLPVGEERQLVRLAQEAQRAVIAGALWRTLPTMASPHPCVSPGPTYLVNEALVVLPIPRPDGDDRPPVRLFTVRKPSPATNELGFAKALSQRGGGQQVWKMLPGKRWYRFVHPGWGDFTVAICSDLLDPAPWASLRGEMLHLFTCAYNQDVDL